MEDTGKKGIFQDDWIQNKRARLLRIPGRREHADGGRLNCQRFGMELDVETSRLCVNGERTQRLAARQQPH
eukprot:15756554-Heterocapsa_arctica.AAC.1